ncbi:ABC transporter permease [Microbacterium sp. No. 7]|uniref:ABC transporter permease n=1 Tax=Microbacterium sp. No. 7 TaxID=1714373 RepID=UPI0006CF3701|nr:ABC transporter permease [Microbacterium sp. No. 7]
MMITIARRAGYALLVVLLVTMLTVALLSLTPGSVAAVILGESATPERIAALNAELGLDRPLWEQYGTWLLNALQGDLGTSPVTGVPVMDAIMSRLPVTLELAVLGLAIALATSILLAVLSASFPNNPIDRGIVALTSVFLATPAFVAGPILILVFALTLRAFPVFGWVPLADDVAMNLRSAFLPAVAVAINEIAAFHRVLRADLITTLREDFIAAARAKGMSRSYVLFRHAFRPSSFSLVTIAGINLGRLIGGTIVIETLFGLPGLGLLIATSIQTRDVITVQGVVTFIAVVYVGINMLVDVAYGLLDPRVRTATRARKKKPAVSAPHAQKAVAA